MIPLTKKTRRNIFITLMVVFVLAAPVILAKSLGYKIEQLDDIFTLVKTGGIYLHSDITNAQIYLDDKYVEKNGLLLRNTLIQSLKPEKTYHVVVKKEGMNSWEKTLMVYPSVVSEARVLMLPVEVKTTAVYPFLDKDGIGTTTPQTFVSTQNGIPTNLEYLELQKLFIEATSTPIAVTKPSKKISSATTTSTTTKTIPDYFIKLGIADPDSLKNLIVSGDQVSWLSNDNVAVNWVSDNNIQPYYYCLDLTNCRTLINVDLEKPVISFDFLQGRDDALIVLHDNGLYAVEIDDRSERNIQPIYLGKDLKFEINSRDQIVVLDSEIFYKIEL